MLHNRIHITSHGFQSIEDKLKKLEFTDLPEVQKAIKIAREFGDFSENAELDAAKDRESYILSEISRLRNLLPSLYVPPYHDHSPYVRFGAYVTWKNIDTNETVTYRIVGNEEANITNQSISLNAPIAQSSLSKQVNDIITFDTPQNGVQTCVIVDVKY